MGKHFVFVPLAAHGHVNPTLALAEELVSRGHRVTYATGAEQAPAAERAGATVVVLPWRVDLSVMAGNGYTMDNLMRMMTAGAEELTATFSLLVEPFRADPPDCVCFDIMGLPGRALADKLAVPGVALAPNFVGNEHFSLRSLMWPADFDPTDPRLHQVGRTLGRFAAEQGLRPESLQPTDARARLNLVFLPRAFQIAGDTFGAEFCFLGPALPRSRSGDWRPPGDAPVLLVSLGTVFNDRPDLLDVCVEAFAGTRWHVVLGTGRAAVPAHVPANIEVHRHVPQLDVLRHAAVFVSHTGMGSTMESLLHGVPLVSVPQTPEQAQNGRRAAELGLGRALDTETLTPARLRAAVEEVAADPDVRANLDRWRDDLNRAEAARTGADALEKFLAGTPSTAQEGR